MFSSLSRIAVSPALFAASCCASVLEVAREQIVARKRVVFRAVGFLSHCLYPATIGVSRAGQKPQVFRVKASGVSAYVINRNAFGNLPIEDLIHDDVDSNGCFVSAHLNPCVVAHSRPVLGIPSPFPAICFPVHLALFCNSFQQWLRRSACNFSVLRQPLALPFDAIRLLPTRIFRDVQQVCANGVRRVLLSCAPITVRLVRHRLKMVRIYASSIAASVVNLHPGRNISDENLKRDPVRIPARRLSVAMVLEFAVAFCGFRGGPVPAAGSGVQFKLLNESFKDRSECRHKQNPTRARRLNSANESPNALRGLENLWFSFFCRPVQRGLEASLPISPSFAT